MTGPAAMALTRTVVPAIQYDASFERGIFSVSDRMLVYDDTDPAERVKLYDSGVDVKDMEPERKFRLNVQYRTGNILVPKLNPREALRGVVEEFAASCAEGRAPITDVTAGTRVVRILEAAQKSIESSGERVSL